MREESSYQTKRDRSLRPVAYYPKWLHVRICDKIVCPVTFSQDLLGCVPWAIQNFVSRKEILALATCFFFDLSDVLMKLTRLTYKIYVPALYLRDITVEIKEQFILVCIGSGRFLWAQMVWRGNFLVLLWWPRICLRGKQWKLLPIKRFFISMWNVIPASKNLGIGSVT